MDDVSPPFDHGVLDAFRARRCGVNRNSVAAEIESTSYLRRKGQQSNKHGRNPLTMGDTLVLNQPERGFGIELLHDDASSA